MQGVQQQVIEILETLSSNDQQQVLDFVEFLKTKRQNHKLIQSTPNKPMSALELAGDLVGCLDGGPSDLSTNKAYMEGFGRK